MRPWSLILLLVVCAGCVVRVPYPRGVVIPANATVRADATVRANATVQPAHPPQPPQPPPPPPPPPVAVELQGAPVVEFFGIPLEGAEDVVFVLDCSGSMNDLAQGRIAQITAQGGDPGAPQAGDPGAPQAGDPGAPQAGDPGAPQAGDPGSPPDSPQGPPQAPPPPAPHKIDVARAELADALQRLPAGTRMNVIFFNNSVEASAPGLVPLEETGRERLIGYVRAMGATGSTALAPAMRTAFLMNARRIVLLSDGLGNVGGDSRALLRDAREAMRGGVRIDTIGLGTEQDAHTLQTLARESGGLYQAL